MIKWVIFGVIIIGLAIYCKQSNLNEHYDTIKYPDPDNIIKDNTNVQIPIVSEKSQSPQCNQSLADNYRSAYSVMAANEELPQINQHCKKSKNGLAYVGTNNVMLDPNMDPLILYKKQQRFVKAYLEDPRVSGANLNQYMSLGATADIGRINLSNGSKMPVPDNCMI
jgi:hypothetical protein